VAVVRRAPVNVLQDASWQSSERYLAAVLAKYDSPSGSELSRLSTLINHHLATSRPPDISVAFKNGVNRTHVWVRKERGKDVCAHHLPWKVPNAGHWCQPRAPPWWRSRGTGGPQTLGQVSADLRDPGALHVRRYAGRPETRVGRLCGNFWDAQHCRGCSVRGN